MRIFYQLLANVVLSSVTNMTVWFAIIFFTYLQTQAVLATSLISGIYLVTVAITGFWFGNIVDHNQKKLVMLSSSAISLVAYIIGFFVYTAVPVSSFTQLTSPTLWLLVLVLLVGVIDGNIRTIALPTVITFLIPEDLRDKANGLAGTATGIAFLMTSVISGFLVGHSGMYHVLLLAMVMMSATLVHLWFVPLHEKKIVSADGQSKKLEIGKTLAVIKKVPGLLPLILFTMFNNFLGGVFMALMDAYGLSLVTVQTWGVIWGFLSCAFILGGLIIAKFGLGKNPLQAMFSANITIWIISSFFTIYPSIIVLVVGIFIYLCVVPYIEAAEHTIIQKVVPRDRQGRVFGFAQSVEQAASPLTSFAIGPLTQFIFIPFMTTGAGVELIGSWFGTGPGRGIALVFTITGIIGLIVTLLARNSHYYRQLSSLYSSK
jgi:DHA3 family multidrug efflux protein-like MFS transporter